MKAPYAAMFGASDVTHAIRGAWRYDQLSSLVTVCGRQGMPAIVHRDSGDTDITCKSCERSNHVRL